MEENSEAIIRRSLMTNSDQSLISKSFGDDNESVFKRQAKKRKRPAPPKRRRRKRKQKKKQQQLKDKIKDLQNQIDSITGNLNNNQNDNTEGDIYYYEDDAKKKF
uniref:BZIP domain-containing protein n=1 Tax=Strongyloides papillosus TaxID=174720 RepID=A0A0N5CA58_STREA